MDRDSPTATAQLPRQLFAGDATSTATSTSTSTSHPAAAALYSPSRPVAATDTGDERQPEFRNRRAFNGEPLRVLNPNKASPPNSNSQETVTTSSSDPTDQIFTPAMSDGGMSVANGNGNGNGLDHGHDSSQESQLMQLSHIAAAQEKMQELEAATAAAAGAGLSRKRMADGAVKHTRQSSSASPVYVAGHSRNTSTVSVASTAGSRIGELSAELKTRLSYAMVKVNNGWQSHSIDEVETLASQAASPASSTSTIHGRHGSSASPQLRLSSHRPTQSTGTFSATGPDSAWKESPSTSSAMSPPSITKNAPSLAPPVSIQPSRPSLVTRRNSNPRYTPAFLSNSHHGSPQTPAQPSPVHSTPDHRSLRTPVVDPILFSPHQNVREQDAIESLLFMSSPGNSANLKHNFPSSSQPVSSVRNGITSAVSPHRTALPSSQPRKSLPSGRPSHSSQPLPHGHSQPKRVGFDKSPSTLSDMDVDEQFGTPHGAYTRGTPRRKPNGGDAHARHMAPLSMSSGLSASARIRPELGDADIEQMLDRVAADDSSDSEGEIQIPLSGRTRREGAGIQA